MEKPAAELSQPATDIANADNAQCSVIEFPPDILVARNAGAGAHAAIRFDNTLRKREHHRQGMLGNTLTIAAGLIDDGDAFACAGLNVDGVVACTV
jgi:hypothetical protein